MIPHRARSRSARTALFLLLCLTLVVGPALSAAANPPTCCTDECADGYCPLEQSHAQKASKHLTKGASQAESVAEDPHATCHETEASASPKPDDVSDPDKVSVLGGERAGHGPRLRAPITSCAEDRIGVSGSAFVLLLGTDQALTLAATELEHDARVPALESEPYRTLGARGPPTL